MDFEVFKNSKSATSLLGISTEDSPIVIKVKEVSIYKANDQLNSNFANFTKNWISIENSIQKFDSQFFQNSSITNIIFMDVSSLEQNHKPKTKNEIIVRNDCNKNRTIN